MKIVSYETGGRKSFGAVKNDGIVDLAGKIDGVLAPEDLLIPEKLAEAKKIVGDAPASCALADATLLVPVDRPGKILCIGVNYANRNAEYKDNSTLPEYPSMFFRTPESFVGHGANIVRPPESEQLDYEGEIAIVIGEEGRRIPKEEALDHIAALTILQEGTIRDWLRHSKFNVTQGKNFDRTASIGPWMVTADEFDLTAPMHVTTRVNGEVRQDDTTENIIFDFAYLISYVSTFMTLRRGDIISTGTPTGAGARFDPPKWLVPGDVVEVEVPGIGLLSNEVVDEEV
jgi:2-keto-4-pentenoate hydratase/2-oxohepta-3-ene-1,7-dioic acid hydratase in catechol pathway